MKRILITGAGGQLGRSFAALLDHHGAYEPLLADRSSLDICNDSAVRALVAAHSVKAVINCAAYTAVDDAEENEDLAHDVNAIAPGAIARICREIGIPMVHYSTDYVYHNGLDRPLRENDPTHPKGAYARSKREGEERVTGSGCHHYILRTSWVYAPFGHNFVRTMLRLSQERDKLDVVFDQVGAPTFTFDLARTSLLLLDRCFRGDNIPEPGIYNYANDGVCSWYDFAAEIFRVAGREVWLTPVRTGQFPRPATRPHYSLMDQQKIRSALGHPPRHWTEALRECMSLMT